jgi:hypothetical protein
MMRFKKMAAALIACVAVSASGANAAQANWFVGGVELGASAQETVNIKATSSLAFAGTVTGEIVEITASGLECATAVKKCTIDGSSFGTNHSAGALKFTGVKVVKPAHCTVPGGTLSTVSLSGTVEMKTVAGSTNTFQKFYPLSATTIGTVHLDGGECTLAGLDAPLKGFFYGEVNETGGQAVAQPVKFNTASNSISGLTISGNAATLTGTASAEVISGKIWDVTE